MCLKTAGYVTNSVDPDQMECSMAYDLGPVVQSDVSLTSSLAVKMLTVLVSRILNSVIFAEKM